MDMIDLLAAVAIAVNDQAIAIVGEPLVAGDFRRYGHHAPQSQLMLCGRIIDGGNQDIGNDQNMGRRC